MELCQVSILTSGFYNSIVARWAAVATGRSFQYESLMRGMFMLFALGRWIRLWGGYRRDCDRCKLFPEVRLHNQPSLPLG
jgi:hypothetical protein